MSLIGLNPNAEVLNKSAALHMNINAAKGLQDVLKSNLGPKGTIKMYIYTSLSLSLSRSRSDSLWFCCRLVGGAGDIKLTKDGNTLLKEMVTSLSLALSRKPWIFKSFFVQYAQPVLLALQCSIFFFSLFLLIF